MSQPFSWDCPFNRPDLIIYIIMYFLHQDIFLRFKRKILFMGQGCDIQYVFQCVHYSFLNQ
jgi:hypothetical protein